MKARREAFVGGAFQAFEWQAEILLPGRKAVADMLHRESKVVAELDGARFHGTEHSRQNDVNRDIDLAAAGYLTVRFTWRDICERPAWCRERLLAVVSSRMARTGRS